MFALFACRWRHQGLYLVYSLAFITFWKLVLVGRCRTGLTEQLPFVVNPQPANCEWVSLWITGQLQEMCFIQTQAVYVHVILCPLSGTTWSFHQSTQQKSLFTSHIYSYLSFTVNGFPKVKCLTFTFSPLLSHSGVNESEQKHSRWKTTQCFKCLTYTWADRNCIYMRRKTFRRFIQTLYFQIGSERALMIPVGKHSHCSRIQIQQEQ